MEKLEKRVKLGYAEGIASIIVNTLLFGLKYWAGIVSGSVALIADAWHTLTDTISSLIVIVGVKLSSKRPDEKYPFGYGRLEQISSIFIGFLLAIVAYEFLRESIEKFNAGESANFGTVAIVVTIISIVLKEALAQYAFYIAKRTENDTVKADAWHHRSDALSSVVVLAGIFLRDYFWWIDSLLGLIISLMLFYVVFEIVRDAIKKLLGEDASPELIDEIKKIVIDHTPEDPRPHHFHLHNYGIHKELTFHMKFDGKMDINAGHKIVTDIEKEIKKQFQIVATIHIEPNGAKH